MKRGHCTGHKRERPHATDWYTHREEELIRHVEAQWGIPVPWQEREGHPLLAPVSPHRETTGEEA